MYIEYCGEADPKGYLVDANGVTESVLCKDIPCATATANYNDVTEYLREVVDLMATDDYEVDEILGEDRAFESSQRVDALIDFD